MRKIPQTCSLYSNHFCSELARLTWHCSGHNGEWEWGKRVLKMVCFQNSSHSFSRAEQCYRFEFLPPSLFPQLLIVKQAAVPPNPIGSGGHIRRQERSICSDWSAGGNVALPPFAITDTFHIFSSSFNMSSGKCHFDYFFGFFLWFAAFISEFIWLHRVLKYETLLGFQKIVPWCYVASYLYIFNRGQKSDIVCSPQRYEMQMYLLHYLKR